MRDFIELPQIIKDNSEIYSVKLSDLFHSEDKQENKYSIDYLWSLQARKRLEEYAEGGMDILVEEVFRHRGD